ncbi:MAG: NACHT domain-containing protein [Desulfobacteraceae bacterium]|nr:NACHT domain-containing protein [Desulfobacteraceae bacterium]
MSYQTHITTFYSYKGGVGRTMLLANTGALLAGMGRKVLLWDLDVEAPGMHFIPALTPASPHKKGFLEWLLNLQEKKQNILPDAGTLDALSGLIKPVPEIKNLSILPAFGDKADSAGLYQDIHWQDFLEKKPDQGLELFRNILDHFSDNGEFDHILLDARTGITDLGGLMTAILPHTVILVGSYGNQNLSGLLQIDRALKHAADGKHAVARAPLPDLKRLVVISPVPRDQEKLLDARRAVWEKEFPSLASDTDMETRVEIPFDSRLLFKEDLLSLKDEESEIAAAYDKIARKTDQFRNDLIRLREDIEAEDAAFPDIPHGDRKDLRHEKGKTFESRVARLLTLLGYQVEPEQYIDGNRVDLIAKQQSGLRSECIFVECKNHQKPVGKNVLEKLAVWLNGDQAKAMHAEGMVVANAFSPAALTYANSSQILAFTPKELEQRLFDFGPYLAKLKQEFEGSDLARTYVDQRVLLEKAPDKQGSDLLMHAKKWAAGEGSRLWLLLGDFGTGKTAFFKRFTYELAKHGDDPDMPIPIAVDLKEFPNAISLEGLLQEHLRNYADWNGNPEILLHLLSSGRVVLLLDAFDEMGTAAAGRSIDDQFRQLLKPLSRPGSKEKSRILITCRTHFFKDQQNVKDVLYGTADDLVSQDSELGRLARAFDGTIDELMLFNKEQISMFLKRHLSSNQAIQAEKFIQETYDLPSLAPRPVLLEMIVKSLPDLIRSKNGITPAGLYHLYTTKWLEDKSGGTLQTSPHLRKKILEHLAFDLWGRPLHRIHHRELVAVLEKMEPGLLDGIDPDRVDLELRTAAFLIRSREGFYSFSHKSFREFFFGRHILSSLIEGSKELADALRTAPITPECAAFFCDLVELGQNNDDSEKDDNREILKNHIQKILADSYRRQTSENALLLAYFYADYQFRRSDSDKNGTGIADFMKPFVPDAARLHGALLRGTNLKGAWLGNADLGEALLEKSDLSMVRAKGANFSKALLNGSKLENADYSQADFTNAAMGEVKAKETNFSGSKFDNADLTAAIFVKTICEHASFRKANCHGARFADANLKDADWQDAVTTAVTAPYAMQIPPGVPDLPTKLIPLLQTGHFMLVNSAVFSKNDKTILTASWDKTAALWDLGTGRLVRRFWGHKSMVCSAMFSKDEKKVLTASWDETAALWDIETGKRIKRFKGHKSMVYSAVFSKDGKKVLTASRDKTAALWDIETEKLIKRFKGHESWVSSAVFSKDGKKVLTASNDKTAVIWDIETEKPIKTFKSHEESIHSAIFSKNEKQILTTSKDKTAAIWDIKTGNLIRQFKGHDSHVNSAIFSKDEKKVLTASADNTAVIWDIETGKPITRFKGHSFPSVTPAVFSKDQKKIFMVNDLLDVAALWDIKTGKLIKEFNIHDYRGNHAIFSKDAQNVLTVGPTAVFLWELDTGKLIRQFKGILFGIYSTVFSKDETKVLITQHDNTVKLWELDTKKEIIQFIGHEEPVKSAVFSDDEKQVLTACDDKTAAIWDIETGTPIKKFTGHEDSVNSAVFSKNGKQILTASIDKTAAIWDIETGTSIRKFTGHEASVNSAVFSKDGKHVLTASEDGTAALWKLDTGELITRFKGHEASVNSAVFSKDAKQVLTASEDKTAAIWDIETGTPITRFKGHEDSVISAVFSKDGKQVLTASDDKTAALWDADTATRLMTLINFQDGWLTLDEKGRYTSGGNGLSHLTYYDPDERSACPTLWEAEDLPHMGSDENRP